MKRWLPLILLVLAMPLFAQNKGLPTASVQRPKQPTQSHVRSWVIDDRYGTADTVPVDTAIVSYPDNNPVNNYSIANAWNGNLGSPLQSKIYFDRTHHTSTMFSDAYEAYLIAPDNVRFFNTKTPYSKLVYHSALPRYHEQDYLRALLAMNVNRYLNLGALTNLIYARGQYANQAARTLNAGFFGSYSGRQYSFNALVMFNNFRNMENGGLKDINYILNPRSYNGTIKTYNIPTKLDGSMSWYRNNIFYFHQKYSLGFNRETKLPGTDSVVTDFIPVTSFVHTIKFEGVRRRFVEKNIDTVFYANTYYNNNHTIDSLHYYSLRNTLAVTLEEKFNRKLKFGLAAYIEHELRRYEIISDSITRHAYYNNHLLAGAIISKNEGRFIKYNAHAKVFLLGTCMGEFEVGGNILGEFRIRKDTVQIHAGAYFSNYSADNLVLEYYSNHFQWKNKFRNTLTFKAHGRIELPKRHISAGFNMANITQPIYFGKQATPQQYDGNVQILAVDLQANLHAWKMHLDTKAVLQISSNADAIPLPLFSFYSSFYYLDKFFHVLTMQAGMSCRYHTAYYAPAYMPATGQFYTQDQTRIGNYPEMNVFLNFHLKRVRFYLQYANWNSALFGGQRYFAIPDYPLNPGTLQFGFSWTFYD